MVTKLVTFGAFARIEGPVEGLIHVSELVDRRIAHPKEVVREGDLLPLKIVRIERDRHRLGLSLRRAHEEGEAMGYVFTEGGEVLTVPDAIRAEFEEREGPIPVPAPEPAEATAQATETATQAPAREEAPPAPPAPPRIEEPPMGAMEAAFAEASANAEAPAPLADAPAETDASQEPLSDVAVPEELAASTALENTSVATQESDMSADAEEPVPQEVDEITAG
jgi:hypothetical protein